MGFFKRKPKTPVEIPWTTISGGRVFGSSRHLNGVDYKVPKLPSRGLWDVVIFHRGKRHKTFTAGNNTKRIGEFTKRGFARIRIDADRGGSITIPFYVPEPGTYKLHFKGGWPRRKVQFAWVPKQS